MAKKNPYSSPDAPLRHPDHKRPMTRRDFIAQGFLTGLGVVAAPTIFSLFANPRQAYASLAPDLEALKSGERDANDMVADYNRRRLVIVKGLCDIGLSCFMRFFY